MLVKNCALIVGASGVVGSNLAEALLQLGTWDVTGVSHTSSAVPAGVRSIQVDLLDRAASLSVLGQLQPTHVFYATWTRRDTEAQNCVANGAMIQNVIDAVTAKPGHSVQHMALVTGTKHYLGPFEAYGTKTQNETPYSESLPRLAGENFYYTQEDVLFAGAQRSNFSWSVHRPHTIIGYALGNLMNMGVTLAVYASICRETGAKFIFPGSATQYNGITDMTDATLLAQQLIWAATSPAGSNQAFNTVNGDVFRWRHMWQVIADEFGIENGGMPATPQPMAERMKDKGPVWDAMVQKHGLRPMPLEKLASWWHTDADLSRDYECFNSSTKARLAGFTDYRDTATSFRQLFARLRAQKIIP